MKLLSFPSQSYTLDVTTSVHTYNKTEDSIISALELLHTSINNSPAQDLTKKDFKVVKSLKRKIKEITTFKDNDKDSRIPLPGPQSLILEETEYEILKKLLEANKFSARAAEDVDNLWTIIDSATVYEIPKPDLRLVEATPTAVE